MKTAMQPLAWLLSGLAVLSFSSCGPIQPAQPKKAGRILYQWYPDPGQGEVKVKVDLGEQIATIYRGSQEIGWAFVATGTEGRGTPSGNFTITEKIIDKYSNRYGWIENEFGEVTDDDASPGDHVPPGHVYKPAPMPYWMRLTDWGIGMHVGNIPEPGEPASHGCIRMPKHFVPTLFYKVRVGTPVQIVY